MIVQNVFQTVSAEVTSLQDVLDVVGMTGLQDVQALLCCLQNMWASLCVCQTCRHCSVVCIARHGCIALWFALQDIQASLCGLQDKWPHSVVCKTCRHHSVVCKTRDLSLWFARHAGTTLWFVGHAGITCCTDFGQLKMERVH